MGVRVEIDGVGVVEFDDEFKNLSEAEQQKAVNEVASQYTKSQKPQSNITGQTLTGTYEGIAGMAGAPVDAFAGLLGIDDAFGGSKSIERGLDAISGLAGKVTGNEDARALYSDVDPQTTLQSIGRKGGRVVGESIVAAPALVAAAPTSAMTALAGQRTAPTTTQVLREGFAELGTAAKAAPAAFAAAEGAVSVGAGLGSGIATEVFPENPTAQMVGTMLGATVASGAYRPVEKMINRLKGTKSDVPMTYNEMTKEAGNLYEFQKAQGMNVQPALTQGIADDIFRMLDEKGMLGAPTKTGKPKVDSEYTAIQSQLDKFDAYAPTGMTAAQLQTVRRSLSNKIFETDGSERTALRNMLKIFDDYTSELAPEIKVANNLYSRAMKAKEIDTLLEQLKSRPAYINGDVENAIRTEFRPLLRRIVDGKEMGWTKDEIEMLKNIVQGGNIENAARFFGKFAPRTAASIFLGQTTPALLAFQLSGDPTVAGATALTTAGIGTIGQRVGTSVQQQNIDGLMRQITGGRVIEPEIERRMRAALASLYAGQVAGQ